MPKEPAPYIAHLSKDKKLAPLVAAIQVPVLKKKKNICLRLCASIISQQLSTRVAEVIFKRFLELYKGEEPQPQEILNTPPETLRSIGLSNAKVSYVQNVARFVLEQELDDRTIGKMSDEDLIHTLTQIKGVGKWTVEMLLMFALKREDVFSIDDLIIRKSMVKLYKLEALDKKVQKERMVRIAAKWAPYRTYACLYLWRLKTLDIK